MVQRILGAGNVELDVNLAVILVCPVAIPVLERVGRSVFVGQSNRSISVEGKPSQIHVADESRTHY